MNRRDALKALSAVVVIPKAPEAQRSRCDACLGNGFRIVGQKGERFPCEFCSGARDGREVYRLSEADVLPDDPAERPLWVPIQWSEIRPGDHLLLVDFVHGMLSRMMHVRCRRERSRALPSDRIEVDMIEELLPTVRFPSPVACPDCGRIGCGEHFGQRENGR